MEKLLAFPYSERMSKKRKSVPVAARVKKSKTVTKQKVTAVAAPTHPEPPTSENPEPRAPRLTWQESRFIERYIMNGGNATAAMRDAGSCAGSAAVLGHRMLNKVYILEAIEGEREQIRKQLCFERNDAIAMLIGMASSSMDDFAEVLADPTDKETYASLGMKRFAVESAKQTTTSTEDGHTKITNEVKIISPSERRAVINDLWDKLGLDKTAGAGNRLSFLERFTQLGAKLGRSGPAGGSSGTEGS